MWFLVFHLSAPPQVGQDRSLHQVSSSHWGRPRRCGTRRAWTKACSAVRWLRPCWCCGWSWGPALQQRRHSGTDGNSAIPCYLHQYFQFLGEKLDNHGVRTDLTWNRVSHGDLLLWKWTLRAQRFKQKKSQGDNWTETKSYRFWRVSPLTFENKSLNGFKIVEKICWIVSNVFVRKF